MAKYIVLTHIVTSRPGPDKKSRKVSPPIGSVFDFTDAEVDALRGQTPPALRKAVNEMADGATPVDNSAGSISTARPASRKIVPVTQADAAGL